MPKISKISVIVTVYNYGRYLADAIKSILNQTNNNYEILVIDDGSSDNSKDVAESFPEIRYIFQENMGCSSAYNTGIRISSREYIAFLDADDRWTKNKIELQIAEFEKDPPLDMVFGYHQQFYSPDINWKNRKSLKSFPGKIIGFFKGTMLIKRDSFLKVGYFNEDLKMGDFLDWFSRAKFLGLKYSVISDVILERRIHDKNITSLRKNDRSDYVKIFKAALDRERNRKKGNQ